MQFDKCDIEVAVSRIEHMERLFDRVTAAQDKSEPSVTEDIAILSDYYESGDWLHDYELDEQRLLPPELKRGVLSQDGLYDLLCEIGDFQ